MFVIQKGMVKLSVKSPAGARSNMKTWTHVWDGPTVNIVNALWMTAIFNQAKQRDIGVILAGDFGNYTISWTHWNILGYLFLRGRWI